MKHSWSVGFGT